jgi:hypothetical protein
MTKGQTLTQRMRGKGRRALSAGPRAVHRASGPLALVLALCGVMLVSAGTAAATGPPDGRIYERVSPSYKNGNFVDFLEGIEFGLAEGAGNAVVYPMSGAAGTAYSGTVADYVSRRLPGVGWTTVQADPRQEARGYNIFNESPFMLLPSEDFAKFLFASDGAYVQEGEPDYFNVYLSEDPAREPNWISRPEIANPIPAPGTTTYGNNYVVAGASPNLSTVYLAYAGTLLPEDAARAPYVEGGTETGGGFDESPWGFYEWSGGALHEAGTLPDGKLSPFGAVPAAMGLEPAGLRNDRQEVFQAGNLDNWLSEDGSRAFFLSPDPLASKVTNGPREGDESSCEGNPAPCTSEAPELYLREAQPNGAHEVTLVSRSDLPGHEGEPAPHGPAPVENVDDKGSNQENASFVFGSPDGSHVFFASVDRLTQAAPEGEALKEYDYEVGSGSLTYLPGVQGSITTVSRDGSSFMFLNTGSSPADLEVWHGGPGGGSVMPVAEAPGPIGGRPLEVRYSHVSADGSVFVFDTNSPLSGGFNNGGQNAHGQTPFEVYRYSAATGELVCVSCSPAGVEPSGDAYMSYDSATNDPQGEEIRHANGGSSDPMTTLETRGMSADGSRIFFDTPNALVPQDTNGIRDVYEWESGKLYLISSGTSPEPSFYLDSSESGGDVFFATTAGLVPGDTDEAYDVYDARIPRPGDNPPPVAVPCKGAVCQGPPSTPQLLSAPASETFSGIGNLSPAAPTEVAAQTKTRPLTQKQKLAEALKACKKKPKRRQARCLKRVARRYAMKKGKNPSSNVQEKTKRSSGEGE